MRTKGGVLCIINNKMKRIKTMNMNKMKGGHVYEG
jgi:hypothetical protein